MPNLLLTKEQAEILLDAVECRLDSLYEWMPEAHADVDYNGDETGLENLQVSINHLKGIATVLDQYINQEHQP